MKQSLAPRNALAARAHIGYVHAFFRFMTDRNASAVGKLWVVAAVLYVVMPLDVIPDFAPIIGWLDDLGVVAITLGYLARVLHQYRYRVITVPGTGQASARMSRSPRALAVR